MICFFKKKTAYEMRISDWSSDVCSSDLPVQQPRPRGCADERDQRIAPPKALLARLPHQRNVGQRRGGRRGALPRQLLVEAADDVGDKRHRPRLLADAVGERGLGAQFVANPGAHEDRKSTRLNSSN